MKLQIDRLFAEHIDIATKAQDILSQDIQKLCVLAVDCIAKGNKILLFGNGGSAADAQHIAAELTGRFLRERRSIAAIALTTDTSAITSIANDYGYDRVFERQVEGLANPGDLLIGISTSGNSPNVVKALKKGKQIGTINAGLSGNDGGLMSACCDLNLIVPSNVTARIQEIHILIGHILCGIIEENI
jgi:D-sedoheptulose 7-phosphate isomerase